MNEEDIFLEAIDIDDRTRRAEYIARACAGDEPLRRAVESLVQAHDRPGEFLRIPADHALVIPPGDRLDWAGLECSVSEPSAPVDAPSGSASELDLPASATPPLTDDPLETRVNFGDRGAVKSESPGAGESAPIPSWKPFRISLPPRIPTRLGDSVATTFWKSWGEAAAGSSSKRST